MLDICFKWAEENGMEFNIEKSAFLSDHPPPNYNILDSILNNKDYYKFKIITDFLYKFWNELLLLLLIIIIIILIIIIIKTVSFKEKRPYPKGTFYYFNKINIK